AGLGATPVAEGDQRVDRGVVERSDRVTLRKRSHSNGSVRVAGSAASCSRGSGGGVSQTLSSFSPLTQICGIFVTREIVAALTRQVDTAAGDSRVMRHVPAALDPDSTTGVPGRGRGGLTVRCARVRRSAPRP